MVSESAGQDPDDDPFGGNEPGKGISAKDPVVEIFHDPEKAVAKRRRRLGKCETRNTYTVKEDI